jgi:6,7-dimethyl-8-ribityllumazine synthase
MRRKSEKKEEAVDGKKFKIAIVVSRFNEDICGNMLRGAMETLEKNGVSKKNIRTIPVPGAFEIPLACQKLAKTGKYDGLIALGCVIKGETDHYFFVAGEASRGIMDTMLKFDIPIGFGIITTNNLRQAIARSSGKHNKGAETAQAVLETIRAIK